MSPPHTPTHLPRVLVVEDDPGIAATVVRGLKAAGFAVTLETRGDLALELPLKEPFDVVVLDVNLPGLSGFELLERWRTRLSVPVVVLTASTELEDRLAAFAGGAVDWIPKPFFMEELIARVRARLPTSSSSSGPGSTAARVLHIGAVSIDVEARAATRDGKDLGLTRHELNLLLYLVERPGRAVTRAQLADAVLSIDRESTERTVDSHVARVRKKLGDDGAAIKTVWGIGYRFEAPRAGGGPVQTGPKA